MPYLLAALALHVPKNFHPFVLFSYLVLVLFVFFVVSLGLVLVELTSRLFPTSLAATPPHLAPPLGLVHSAGPIEVFFLNEFLLAVLADLLGVVELAFAGQQSNDILLHFFFLVHQHFVGPVLLLQAFS
jgi:hypothetical protein